MKSYLLKNGIIITPFKTIENHNIILENGKIIRIINNSIKIQDIEKYEILDLDKKLYVTPGFIDIHTHGGGGEDCLGGDIKKISKFKLSQGITGYTPTLVASPLENIFNSFDAINDFIKKERKEIYPEILGVHIEGIYLDIKYRGAQSLEYLRIPNKKECREIIDRSHGLLKIMTLAPEIENCLEVIEILSSYGIVSSVGHSNAGIEIINEAIKRGLTHVTHAFNAMGEMGFSEPGARSPGLEGYILVRDELKLEVIGEITHVHPVIMELIYRSKGPDRIIIITDSMSISGMPSGKYKIGVMTLKLEENKDVARLEDGGLAGSVIPINKAIKTFLENTGATINEAVQMATYNPADSLGVAYRKGSIETGKDADITILDSHFEVKKVFIAGKLVYEN